MAGTGHDEPKRQTNELQGPGWAAKKRRDPMPAKIIVSYDGTANEDDAVALGRIFALAGGDGDGGGIEAAQALAGALRAEVAPVAGEDTDLLVLDSRADGPEGRVTLSSSAEHLIEIATSAVLALPRGARLELGGVAGRHP